MKFDYFTNKYVLIGFTDLNMLLYVILLLIAAATFPTDDAPANISKPMKVMYYKFADLFSKKFNPNYFGIAVAAVLIFGLSKICLAATWWKRSKMMVALISIQGTCIALLALVNE